MSSLETPSLYVVKPVKCRRNSLARFGFIITEAEVFSHLRLAANGVGVSGWRNTAVTGGVPGRMVMRAFRRLQISFLVALLAATATIPAAAQDMPAPPPEPEAAYPADQAPPPPEAQTAPSAGDQSAYPLDQEAPSGGRPLSSDAGADPSGRVARLGYMT